MFDRLTDHYSDLWETAARRSTPSSTSPPTTMRRAWHLNPTSPPGTRRPPRAKTPRHRARDTGRGDPSNPRTTDSPNEPLTHQGIRRRLGSHGEGALHGTARTMHASTTESRASTRDRDPEAIWRSRSHLTAPQRRRVATRACASRTACHSITPGQAPLARQRRGSAPPTLPRSARAGWPVVGRRIRG
jgi:hypothetical protein